MSKQQWQRTVRAAAGDGCSTHLQLHVQSHVDEGLEGEGQLWVPRGVGQVLRDLHDESGDGGPAEVEGEGAALRCRKEAATAAA